MGKCHKTVFCWACKKEACNIQVTMDIVSFSVLENITVEGFHAEWHLEYKNSSIIQIFETVKYRFSIYSFFGTT